MKRIRRNHIRFFQNFQPLLRAMTVISAVAVLVTGVTFAALQSQQVSLTGNSINSATAGLQIGTSATSFAASHVGFQFRDLVPGGGAVPADGNVFYLKNTGSAALVLKASINSTPVNTDNVDLSKVYIVVTRVDSGTSNKFAVGSLIAAGTSNGLELSEHLTGSATVAPYKLQVSMDEDAFAGQSANITGIDITFGGTAATQ